jgi:drug/metabolite transporter (DMT)-like permease
VTASSSSSTPRSAYAALVGMTLAFGFSFVATKEALRGFEPLLIALIRFAGAGAILWVIRRVTAGRETLPRGELRKLAALGFVSLTVYFTFENIGIAHTSASDAAILIAAIPIFVSVLNVFTLKETNSLAQWTGIGLSFVGVVALIELGRSGAGGATLGGNLLVLAASLSAAVYNLMARRLLGTRPALLVTTWQNLFGALFMLPPPRPASSTSPSSARWSPTCC